jgi:hypothetical protein
MVQARSEHDLHHPAGTPAGTPNPGSLLALQPKGSCWYCDQPVDSVRRFCSSNCRDDYLEEEAEFGGSE